MLITLLSLSSINRKFGSHCIRELHTNLALHLLNRSAFAGPCAMSPSPLPFRNLEQRSLSDWNQPESFDDFCGLCLTFPVRFFTCGAYHEAAILELAQELEDVISFYLLKFCSCSDF